MSTKIEWCDETWNPITGCTPVSSGCKHCYAKRMFGRNLWDYDFTPGTVHSDRLHIPSRWKKPRKIFVCSMGDLFHPACTYADIFKVMSEVEENPQHTFMMLTKRPQRMADFFKEHTPSGVLPWPNIWLGVTAENQARADERIPILFQVPAAVRFVSVEPMLGPVAIGDYDIDWVIAGPETGPGKRPCDELWIESLSDQCTYSGVPFFDKSKEPWRREFPTVENKI